MRFRRWDELYNGCLNNQELECRPLIVNTSAFDFNCFWWVASSYPKCKSKTHQWYSLSEAHNETDEEIVEMTSRSNSGCRTPADYPAIWKKYSLTSWEEIVREKVIFTPFNLYDTLPILEVLKMCNIIPLIIFESVNSFELNFREFSLAD